MKNLLLPLNLFFPLSLLSQGILLSYLACGLFLMGLDFPDIALILFINVVSYVPISIAIRYSLFFVIFKKYKYMFPDFNETLFLRQSPKEQTKTLKTLYSFPLYRACFILLVNLVKIIPIGLVFTYLCRHNFTTGVAWLYIISLLIVFVPLSSKFLFLESHIYITKLIRDIHRKHELTPAFKNFIFERSSRLFSLKDYLALPLFTASFIVQVTILLSTQEQSYLKTFFAIVIGCIIWGRLYYQERKYLLKGILEIEKAYERLGRKTQTYIPLASSQYLIKIHNIFNKLTEKLEKYEGEVVKWITKEGEENRFRTIGEISSLVGHDLKGPIHGIYFSINELKEENVNEEKRDQHIDYITKNTDRIKELANNLNSSLRNSDGGFKYNHLFIAHRKVIELLRYESLGIEKVEFNIESLKNSKKVKIFMQDLVHILHNLYKNSLKNFNENNIQSPKITLDFLRWDQENKQAFFKITDNGTGFSKEKFESLTGMNFDVMDKNSFHRGLGLRLIRGLIERNHGTIANEDYPEGQGTSFILGLPTA